MKKNNSTTNKVGDLKYDDKNFNRGTKSGKKLMQKSLSKFGAGRSILIDKNNRIIAGNKTTENFKELGLENVKIVETDGNTLVAVKRNDIDLDTSEGREFALADNQTAKTNIDFDFEQLESELDESTLQEWSIDTQDHDDDDYKYTRKIKSVHYEPKDQKPRLKELYNKDKTEELIAKINSSNIDSDIKSFLIDAANRHTVFNYQRIADFYAHSDKDVQQLMEQSALIIIDFEKAIDLGYVKLTKDIAKSYKEQGVL